MGLRSKVFGIGFHKTGTKSLAEALTVLGYRVCGPTTVKRDPDLANNALPNALPLAEQFDAFQDNPWPMLFREMDAHFPGSKFVLTIRPTDEWYRSVLHFFGERETPMRRWIYGDGAGSPVGNEAVYKARYDAHNADVRAYFASRPESLFVLNLPQANWADLCAFLGCEAPKNLPYPHKNPGSRRG